MHLHEVVLLKASLVYLRHDILLVLIELVQLLVEEGVLLVLLLRHPVDLVLHRLTHLLVSLEVLPLHLILLILLLVALHQALDSMLHTALLLI